LGIAVVAAAAILAGGYGLLQMLPGRQSQPDTPAAELSGTPLPGSPTPTRSPASVPAATPTPLGQALIAREMIPFPSDTPLPSATPTPTPPEIEWTQAEKNALAWLCYGEVGGMQEAKVDACLSVISTVRARYAYYNGFNETDVIGTLLRPGQFNVTIHADAPSPDPDLNWTVELYVSGVRGTCTGFLYFDSVPGGPSLCTIRSGNGQWVEFHSGW
jgi:hypothetical protein